MLSRLADLVGQRASTDAEVQPIARTAPIGWRDFALGDLLRAQIVAALPDGRFEAVIENQPVILRLPFQAQPGDAMQLVVTGRDPHLRLALAASDQSTAARLSDTARFITDLLSVNEKLPLVAASATGTPVLPGPAGTSAAVATELRLALAHSGMFYESHQAQWIAGQRTLAELRKEPQASLRPLRGAAVVMLSTPSPNATALLGDSIPQNTNALANRDALAIVGAQTESHASEPLTRAALKLDGTTQSTNTPESPVHRDALAIVRQQLDVLDTRNVIWTGLIWPGQQLDWEIGEQPRESAAAPEATEWRTRLHLELPRLGAVTATLVITPGGVNVRVQAEEHAAAGLLAEHRAGLREALHAAGIIVTGLTVDNDGTD